MIESRALICDLDGHSYEYRLENSRLERRSGSSVFWHAVTGNEFVTMCPAELRHVADVIEAGPRAATK